MTHPDRTKDQFPPPAGQGAPPPGSAAAGGEGAGPAPAAQGPAAQGPAAQTPAAPARHHVVRRSRLGGAWVGLALGAVVLVLLLVFILENGRKVDISFFGAHGHVPLGVALLLAAALGVLLVVIPGTGRIVQLRRTARRHRKSDAAAADPASAVPPQPGSAPADGTVANRQ
jgi:uncharacterized integral membrane protein